MVSYMVSDQTEKVNPSAYDDVQGRLWLTQLTLECKHLEMSQRTSVAASLSQPVKPETLSSTPELSSSLSPNSFQRLHPCLHLHPGNNRGSATILHVLVLYGST